MPLPTETIWSDFDINFAPHPVSGDLGKLNNADAVKQSVKLLVLTQHYERLFQPFLGSNVTHYLFENFDPITSQVIKQDIEEVIDNHEPRADLLEVTIGENADRNELSATIVFRIVNEIEPVQLTVILARVR